MFALVSHLGANVIIEKDQIGLVLQRDQWMDAGCTVLESGNMVKFMKLPEMKLVDGKFDFINNLKKELDGELRKLDTPNRENSGNSQKIEMLEKQLESEKIKNKNIEKELEILKKENEELEIYKTMFLHFSQEFENSKKTLQSMLKDCNDINSSSSLVTLHIQYPEIKVKREIRRNVTNFISGKKNASGLSIYLMKNLFTDEELRTHTMKELMALDKRMELIKKLTISKNSVPITEIYNLVTKPMNNFVSKAKRAKE